MSYEYVLIDGDGVSREDFDTWAAAVAELARIENTDPGATKHWMLVAYDEAGNRVRESWADDLIADGLSYVTVGEGVGAYRPVPRAAKSGKGPSKPPAFRRPPRVAKGTRVLSEAGMAEAKAPRRS